jgi:hypothetical protein
MPPIGLQEIKSNRKARAVTEITDSLTFDGKGNTTQADPIVVNGRRGRQLAVTSVIFSSSPDRNDTRLGA